ncbi:hypothetical protein HYU15_00865 [Candidatus Woesearchaeota archaeon]|nr:hypothetical protein [Candidatus Woesearchaeota archaeon]
MHKKLMFTGQPGQRPKAAGRPFRSSRKAVSPLIATVLLIAFAVALGAVVMNWGRSYTEQTAENVKKKSDVDVKCSLDVKMKLLELSSKPQLCLGQFTLLNDGTKKIEAVDVMVIGDTGIAQNTSVPNSSVSVAGAVKVSAAYTYASVGSLKKVRLIPVVEIGGVQQHCSGTGSVLEKDVADIIACNSS